MNDYIRKAVELADGFSLAENNIGLRDSQGYVEAEYTEPFILDALAAQLVRQLCAIPKYDVIISKDGTEVYSGGHVKGVEYDIKTISMARSDDITMNTIKAIVDSGVLAALDKEQT